VEYPVAILNKVVIEREGSEEVTKGGIIIPDTVKGKPTVGHVVSVGPDVDTSQVDIGHKVFFDLYSGTNCKLGGVEYVIMLMKDILCVLKTDTDEKGEEDGPSVQSVGQEEGAHGGPTMDTA
jgi:chaperonin GroES